MSFTILRRRFPGFFNLNRPIVILLSALPGFIGVAVIAAQANDAEASQREDGIEMPAPTPESSQVFERPSTVSPADSDTGLPLDTLLDMEIPSVFSASKWEQPVTEAPSSVTVITRHEIQRHGHRTLADILHSVRSTHVSHDRIYSYLGLRGVNRGDFNSRALILINGHRLNNNLSDGALIGTGFLLDVDLIERVEVIRGPGSTLYGNNAFFGVINVVTRDGADFSGRGVELAGAHGSFDTHQGRFTYGYQSNQDTRFLLSGSASTSHGQGQIAFPEFNQPFNQNGWIVNGDSDRFHSLFGTLRWRQVTLEGGFIDREKQNPTPLFTIPAFGTPGEFVDQRAYLRLGSRHELSETTQLSWHTYYDRYQFDGFNFFTGPPVFRNVQEQVGESWGTELQLDNTLWDRHKLSIGAEYRNIFRQDFRIFNELPGAILTPTDERQDTSNYGVFLQTEWELHERMRLNAGLRYDDYEVVDPDVNPRIAFIVEPWKQGTFKAIYGTAFRAPNIFERDLAVPGIQLDSETIRTTELIYEQGIGRRVRASLSVFYNDMDDLMTLTSTGLPGFVNGLDAEAKGVELELSGRTAQGFQGTASYVIQEVEDSRTGERLNDSPAHLFKLSISAPIFRDRVFLGWQTHLISSRATQVGRPVPGYAVSNLTLFANDLPSGWEFTAGLYNLFDRRYEDPATPSQELLAGVEQAGRTFMIKLVRRF